jgi:hypothetical protein
VGARALVIAGALVAGCAGPDPRIERVEITPPRLPGHVRVDLVVVNQSGGHGQVQVELQIRSTRPARTVAAERVVEMEGHQRIELMVDIPAPEADYVAQAQAVYPD